jgi:hypothetical protein
MSSQLVVILASYLPSQLACCACCIFYVCCAAFDIRREQILDTATSTLSTTPSLSSQEAADAAAAIAMLQGLGTAAALQQFLGCRKQWVQQRLLQALSAAAAAQQDPGAVLAELAQQVQSCIAQVADAGWLAVLVDAT